METKLIGDLSGVHGVRKILLVSKDKKESIPKLILVQHSLEFLPSLRYTLSIVGIDNEDNTLGILEVCKTERS